MVVQVSTCFSKAIVMESREKTGKVFQQQNSRGLVCDQICGKKGPRGNVKVVYVVSGCGD